MQIKTRLRLMRYWLRHAVPWTTRLEYRDMFNSTSERMWRLEEEYTVARDATSMAIEQRNTIDQKLTATEAGLRKFLEGMRRASEVQTVALANLLEVLPDHTPQDAERRRVVDGLRAEVSTPAPVHFSMGRHGPAAPDRYLVIPPNAPEGQIIGSFQEAADADIILDLRGQHPRVVKNRYGPEHDNVILAGG